MSWLPFVLGYAALTLIIGVILHRRGILRVDSLAVVRATIVASALLLLGELLAEERGLWLIPAHSGAMLMRTPVETMLLIVTTVVSSLQVYVLVGLVMPEKR